MGICCSKSARPNKQDSRVVPVSQQSKGIEEFDSEPKKKKNSGEFVMDEDEREKEKTEYVSSSQKNLDDKDKKPKINEYKLKTNPLPSYERISEKSNSISSKSKDKKSKFQKD